MAHACRAKIHPNIRRILVPIDLTSCSDSALAYASGIAERLGAMLHIVHVIGPEPTVGSMGEPYIESREVEDEAVRRAREKVTETVPSLPYEITVHRGSVWKLTSRVATERDMDLMVLGTHGRHGPSYVVRGSVAESVLRHSPCPVITIGPGVEKGRRYWDAFKKIVAATDFSAASVKALNYAVQLATWDDGSFILFHAVSDEMTETAEEYDLHSAELIAEARERLVSLIVEGQVMNRRIVRIGPPAESIVEIANEVDADLIAMGAHAGVAGASHWVKSVDHEVISNAPCPVLTVCN